MTDGEVKLLPGRRVNLARVKSGERSALEGGGEGRDDARSISCGIYAAIFYPARRAEDAVRRVTTPEMLSLERHRRRFSRTLAPSFRRCRADADALASATPPLHRYRDIVDRYACNAETDGVSGAT